MKNTTNLSDGEKTPQGRDNLDLFQLCLELYARTGNQLNNKKMHDYAFEAISELKKRLSDKPELINEVELREKFIEVQEKYDASTLLIEGLNASHATLDASLQNQYKRNAELTARLAECEKAFRDIIKVDMDLYDEDVDVMRLIANKALITLTS